MEKKEPRKMRPRKRKPCINSSHKRGEYLPHIKNSHKKNPEEVEGRVSGERLGQEQRQTQGGEMHVCF